MKSKEQQPVVQYDQIASTYDQRYTFRNYEGVAKTLHFLTRHLNAKQVLEVGCGTGHWLSLLQDGEHQIYGLDLSFGMLQEARKKNSQLYLTCGQAFQLPYANCSFDLIFCVNAFHHFPQPRLFVEEARRLLKPGGALGIIGMDPHACRDRWYIYDYFKGTKELDLERFPSSGTIMDWMAAVGMNPIERRVAERLVNEYNVGSVQEDPFLRKNNTSQLILLSDESYRAGLRRIEQALMEAQNQGKQLLLPVDITLILVCGYV